MCEYSRKLIAWLDGELEPAEAIAVESHLNHCATCGSEVRVYERVSSAMEAYCEVTLAACESHEAPRPKTVLLSAGAIAAVVVLFFVSTPVREVQPLTGTAAPTAPLVPESARHLAERVPNPASEGSPVKRAQRPLVAVAAAEKSPDAGWVAGEPAIQITIPADAVLPPGAAPDGMDFVADVRIAADGSAQEVFVRP